MDNVKKKHLQVGWQRNNKHKDYLKKNLNNRIEIKFSDSLLFLLDFNKELMQKVEHMHFLIWYIQLEIFPLSLGICDKFDF
jgi:hypothetical protein